MAEHEIVQDYTHFLILPLKLVGCWDWYMNPRNEFEIIFNNTYFSMVMFVLVNLSVTLMVNIYTEWVDMMGSLENIADGLPLLVSAATVFYFGTNKKELYELSQYINTNFRYHSARGLTNMTMYNSYKAAKNFGFFYTACTLFSVSMYVALPVTLHLWKKQPLQHWNYMDMDGSPFFEIALLRQAVGQIFLALSVGQFGILFAANSILICGQLDLLCCSLRNARYSALLQNGVQHHTLAANFDIQLDEQHNYSYNAAVLKDSGYHYDLKWESSLTEKTTHFDIYARHHDEATSDALRECAQVCQTINEYKDQFEKFASPLLVIRVVQVTLYLCTLLYAATKKFDMVTVEYLAATALDIFIYCYYGNQVILQADRVSTAAYQSSWHTMGVKPRKVLLNVLLANKKAISVRASRFLHMDLRTFINIIKTSFSYYTLLVNVNEKK